MTNRADPTKVRTVYLDDWLQRQPDDSPHKRAPACGCGGGHHERDSAVLVVRLGYGAKGAIRETARRAGIEAANLTALLRGVRSWNLVLEDGSPRPLDATEVALLDDTTVDWLLDELDGAWAEDPLPNASGDSSPDGSQANGTRTPTTPPATATSQASTGT